MIQIVTFFALLSAALSFPLSSLDSNSVETTISETNIETTLVHFDQSQHNVSSRIVYLWSASILIELINNYNVLTQLTITVD